MLSPWRTAEQMPLPGMPEPQPVEKPQTETLYRGVRISPNLEPGLEETAFSLYGRPGEGGDLFGNSSMRMGPTHDPGHGTTDDARHIIDWLNSPGRLKYHHNLPGWEGEEEGQGAKPRGYGLGPHWTTDRETAEMAATLYPGNVGAVMEAEHPVGEGVDPYTHTHQHEHPDEHETRLFPGAPLSIKRMHLYHPKLKTWHTHEFDQPLNYTASVSGSVDDHDHPAEGEGFDAWRSRLWDGVLQGKTFNPNAPGSHYRAMSNDEYQAGLSDGAFRPLIGDHLYVTDDPDRLSGGAYGARGGGHIVEFTPQPTQDIPSGTIGNRLMEKGVTHIPLDAVRRVWSWNGTDHMPMRGMAGA